jgi:hypothetical protein
MFNNATTYLKWMLPFVVCAANTSYAQMCKYVDEDGRVTYSNIANAPPKGAKKEKCFDAPPPLDKNQKPRSANAETMSQEQFPSVDSDTQKQRDDGRRAILQNELAQEQSQLAAAKRALAEGEAIRLGDEKNYQKYLDRIQKLRDDVSLHEKNINALNQELANLN